MLIISLSSINFINLYFMERIEEHYNSQLMFIKKQFPSVEEFDDSNLKRIYFRHGQLTLLWEAVLTIFSIVLFYLILSRHSERERKYQEFLELIIVAISHKFGNFLSAMKLNIEVIKSTKSLKPLQYIEDYTSKMDEDIKSIIEILKKGKEEKIERVKIEDKIQKVLEKLDIKDRKIIKSLKSHSVETDTNILENILFILLHNSYKYSKSFIHIKTTKKNTLIIRNDITPTKPEGGSGIGLELANRMCQLNGWKMKTKRLKNHFTVFICF